MTIKDTYKAVEGLVEFLKDEYDDSSTNDIYEVVLQIEVLLDHAKALEAENREHMKMFATMSCAVGWAKGLSPDNVIINRAYELIQERFGDQA